MDPQRSPSFFVRRRNCFPRSSIHIRCRAGEEMTDKQKAVWAAVCALVALLALGGIGLFRSQELRSISGAVLQLNPDPGKQLPIANVEVSLGDNLSAGTATSDAAGFFRLTLRPGVRVGQAATIRLRQPDYRPLDFPEYLQDRLYVLRLVPRAAASLDPPVLIGDLRVRYTVKSETTVNVGSASKTFEVVNNGDVPCPRHSLCSPDGKWKAAISGASIDAGEGNQFHDARVSCIAGPCPFTKIENNSFSKGGPRISVSVRNWSDTASFLLEAEVARTTSSDGIRQSFPVIFGQTMSFTLPPPARGSSIEATVNGSEIVYPFERTLNVSWAGCSVNVAKGGTRLYRCELKPGYRFR